MCVGGGINRTSRKEANRLCHRPNCAQPLVPPCPSYSLFSLPDFAVGSTSTLFLSAHPFSLPAFATAAWRASICAGRPSSSTASATRSRSEEPPPPLCRAKIDLGGAGPRGGRILDGIGGGPETSELFLIEEAQRRRLRRQRWRRQRRRVAEAAGALTACMMWCGLYRWDRA